MQRPWREPGSRDGLKPSSSCLPKQHPREQTPLPLLSPGCWVLGASPWVHRTGSASFLHRVFGQRGGSGGEEQVLSCSPLSHPKDSLFRGRRQTWLSQGGETEAWSMYRSIGTVTRVGSTHGTTSQGHPGWAAGLGDIELPPQLLRRHTPLAAPQTPLPLLPSLLHHHIITTARGHLALSLSQGSGYLRPLPSQCTCGSTPAPTRPEDAGAKSPRAGSCTPFPSPAWETMWMMVGPRMRRELQPWRHHGHRLGHARPSQARGEGRRQRGGLEDSVQAIWILLLHFQPLPGFQQHPGLGWPHREVEGRDERSRAGTAGEL